MKKKLLATAMTAAAATLASSAFAQVSITSPLGNAPRVAPGGTVQFDEQHIISGAANDLGAGYVIHMALPEGANFSGTPTATASAGANAVRELELVTNNAGVPGSKGQVNLVDTNNDGGFDLMKVTVATPSDADDLVIIRGSLVYTGTKASGALNPTIYIHDENGNVVPPVDTDNVLATRVSAVNNPLTQLTKVADITVPTKTADPVSTPTPSSILVIVPNGAEAGDTVTLSLGAGVEIDEAATVSMVPLTDGAPTATGADGTPGDGKWSFTLDGDVSGASQYLITIDDFEVLAAAKAGTVNATFGGTAGVSGSVAAITLAASGSKAALPTTDPATTAATTKVIAGATQSVVIPDIEIIETFPGDLGSGGNITLTAGSGLVFDDTVTPTVANTTNITFGVPTVSTKGDTIIVPVTGNSGAFGTDKANTVVISGIAVTATKNATGVLNITVGDPSADVDNVPGTVLGVATAAQRGTVTIEGPDPVATVGKGQKGINSVFTLEESVYGSITTANANTPIIQIVPPTGVTITGVSADAPTAGEVVINPVGQASVPADGSWVLFVNSEGTVASDVDVTVTYDVGSSVAVGTDLTFTLTGNAGVSGDVVLASVSNATKTTVSAIPPVTPGVVDSQNLATITITENLVNGMSADTFRLIAPTGVTFAPPPASTFTNATGTVGSTFHANDTLVINVAAVNASATDTVTITPKAFVGPNVADNQLLAFNIVDGDAAGENTTGIVGGSVNLAYSGDIGTLEAGAAVAVNVGFSATNVIEGGLAPYTVSSSDNGVAGARVNGNNVTVTGTGTGTATVTVTDALGSTDTYLVTVSAATGEQIEYDQDTIVATDGSTSNATFSAGASTDGGNTFETEFTSGEEVTVVGTINPDAADVGQAGGLFVVVRTQIFNDAGEAVESRWFYQDVDGNFQAWDTRVSSLEPAVEVDALQTVHHVQVFEGTLAAATHKVFLGYMVDGGPLVYTSVPMELNVTEE